MPAVYLVGGALRDFLTGNDIKDLDFAVEAESYEDMKSYLLSLGLHIFLETPEYFTIRGILPCGELGDFVLCRKDGTYSDGRHPDSVEPGTIYDDLGRRDYTVNAMALLLDDVMLQVSHFQIKHLKPDLTIDDIIDPYGGLNHLYPPTLHPVGNVYLRWREDSLRFLRAIRFMITKGYTLSPEITEAIHWAELPILLRQLKTERILAELTKCFQFDSVGTMLVLTSMPHQVLEVLFQENPIWLMPTNRKRSDR